MSGDSREVMPMRLRELTSDEELMRVHVPYEIRKLEETAMVLTTPGLLQPIMVDAFIEAFAIHARNLIEFFDGTGAVAATEFTDTTYEPFRGGRIPEDVAKKLHTQVAHITRARTNDASKKLNSLAVAKLLFALQAEVTEFVRHLQPKHELLPV